MFATVIVQSCPVYGTIIIANVTEKKRNVSGDLINSLKDM
jgi:hypothetical protein